MRKITRILLIVILIPLLTPLLPQKALAGDLGVTIRINRLAVSKATSGMICATPESTGVENSVQVIFPTGFTVNSTASNWTVTTTNLPSGSSALPGIGTATAVSGQTVTFPSNDLVAGTEYCFNFSSSNTLTTPSSTGTYNGILRTMNSSNTTIDTRDYGISIVSNDGIAVSATVAANPTDFSASLALTSPANGTFPQNTTLDYTLTYGSSLTYPSSMTVEASWDLGTIQGGSSPTEDILDYVIGSASNAYNSTPPVIDSVNRKIDWTIPIFPGNTTNQTVSFKLKTNNSYSGSLPVSFSVNGRVFGPGTVTPDSTITSSYQNSSYLTPTPTPTCTPGTCPTAVPASITPTPTVTPVVQRPTVTDIQIRTISSTQAAIFVVTSKQTSIKISYGASQTKLNQTVISKTLSNQHLLELNNLKPNTRYYFKVTATDQNGKSTTSDLYVFDTANNTIPPRIINYSLILTSSDIVLTDPLRTGNEIPRIVLPINTSYSFKFAVTNADKIKIVKAYVRNNNVLGLNSFQDYSSSKYLTVTEISPGQYIGKLSSGYNAGTYKVVVQIHDFDGNITEETLTTLYVVEPFRVTDAITKQPVENARVTFFYFNTRLKTYESLSSNITPVKNPNFSEPDGIVPTVLPQGKYRADVTSLGYESKTVDFEINNASSNYPTIQLQPLPFSIMTYIKYSASTANDVFELLRKYIHTLRTSIRFFELIAFIVIILFSTLSLLSFANRMSVPFFQLPYFMLYHTTILFKKPLHTFLIHGKVDVIGGEIVPYAFVYLSFPNGKVITHTTTNSEGEFFAKIHEATEIKITVSKKGFKNVTLMLKKDTLNDKITIELTQILRPKGFNLETLRWYTGFLLGSLFETILLITLFIEILFTIEFGVFKVIPFILVSLLNIFFWTMYTKHSRSVGN